MTINDFANSTIQRNRPKKVYSDTLAMKIIDEDQYDPDNTENSGCSKIDKTNNKELEDINHVYNDYHIDIWFLVSEYIRPEDTCRFALICQKTANVVCSGKYWMKLYRRFYSKRILALPSKFRPDRMDRIGGLRAKVICSLFYTYASFIKRLTDPQRHHPTKLENLFLKQTWYKHVKQGVWIFYYRFSNKIKTRSPIVQMSNYDDDDDLYNLDSFVAHNNNIFTNRFEGQYLLMLTSERFIPFPDFHNQEVSLALVRQPLSKDLRSTGLELTFTNYIKLTVAVARYDNVIEYKIFNWWDPEFSSITE